MKIILSEACLICVPAQEKYHGKTHKTLTNVIFLLAAVQGSEIQHVDAPAEPHRLNPGDILIAASDGLETCSQDELVQIVTAGRPSAPDIVEAVLESVVETDRLGQDNASLVVYRYR